jgi:hypothetical protein
MGIKTPAMVRTFKLIAIEFSTRKRHSSMRAGVPKGKRLALLVASEDERLFEQHRRG